MRKNPVAKAIASTIIFLGIFSVVAKFSIYVAFFAAIVISMRIFRSLK